MELDRNEVRWYTAFGGHLMFETQQEYFQRIPVPAWWYRWLPPIVREKLQQRRYQRSLARVGRRCGVKTQA